MNLFDSLVSEAHKNNPSLSSLAPVVEKEILHHDILREMSAAGILERLTFMGGTCLRACYGSNRLSEDLDFSGGAHFNRDSLKILPSLMKEKLFVKYGLQVEISEPKRETGNVDTWKLKMVTLPEQRGIPVQRINIDVCAVPSYDRQPMMLKNHYGIDMGTSGLIVQVESRAEILADKFIALALRQGRIKNRDLWDIVWLKQQGIELAMELLRKKISDYAHTVDRYMELLDIRRVMLKNDEAVRIAFEQEMRRFLPSSIVTETVENRAFWGFLVNLVTTECEQIIALLSETALSPLFKM